MFSLLVETSKFYPCLRFVQGYLEVDVSLEVFAPLSLFCCLFHNVEVNALNCWMLAFTVCLCPYNEKMMLRSFIWFYFSVYVDGDVFYILLLQYYFEFLVPFL